ncbi:hypothetical protein ACQCT6_02785 [Cytobacillus gottheilii]|uniref:hypothetical protein n=1 Tax=Cytobacillus gottheilii TaxID=859144 RepID=UPI003CF9C9C4
MVSLFRRKKEEDDEYIFETSDLLIVFDDEKKISDINRVTAVNEDAVIVAGLYKVPLEDCEITTGKEGRNFFYRAPSKSITETQRLAQLEISTVLEQVTAYRPPVPTNNLDGTKIFLFALIFVAFIVLGITGCQA